MKRNPKSVRDTNVTMEMKRNPKSTRDTNVTVE